MIDPIDEVPLDDSDGSDKEDQLSQQDIHSNGLDEERIPPSPKGQPDTDHLQQASDASEASFMLDVDKGIDAGTERE